MKESWDIRFKKIAYDGAIQIRQTPPKFSGGTYNPPKKEDFIKGWELFVSSFVTISDVPGLSSSSTKNANLILYEAINKWDDYRKIEFLKKVGTEDAWILIREKCPFWKSVIGMTLLCTISSIAGGVICLCIEYVFFK
jgi:hypothetical protein